MSNSWKDWEINIIKSNIHLTFKISKLQYIL